MFDTPETSLTFRCISSVRKLHLVFVTFSSGNRKMAQRVINHCLNSAGKGPVVFSTETLRLRFGHLTANGKHWFAVSGFTLSVQDSRVVARSCNVCFYSIVHFYFSWEIVFKVTFLCKIIRERVLNRSILSQIWDSKSLTSGAWSSCTN